MNSSTAAIPPSARSVVVPMVMPPMLVQVCSLNKAKLHGDVLAAVFPLVLELEDDPVGGGVVPDGWVML